ncbi:hypothetical protein P389DRAFT_207573 [Cystobasidium minutum MCA 4210]|uniref:uncharacterized protein n=1 Tax=Cystobasidium minutum MCA 4210 TaxID=1397322 RepID=UPI0034CFE08E|eukprot:jgi/Rhomi1/207573/estExt_Genemark1.C_1_t10500
MDADNAGTDGTSFVTSDNGTAAPLQAEIQTAHAALKSALLQLGLLSRFQRDVRTLGVQDYASKPPSNLTNALTQALKAYNDACNNMEMQIMRAKAALLYDGPGEEEPPQADEAVAENKKSDIVDAQGPDAIDVDEPMAGVPEQASPKNTDDSTAQPSTVENESPAVSSKEANTNPPSQSISSTSLLNVDDMEDLFGSGVSRSDTSNSTPANAGTLQSQQPQPDQNQQPQAQGEQPQQSQPQSEPFPAASSTSSLTANSSLPAENNASSGMAAVSSQTSDPTASLFGFDNSSNPAIGTTDMNFDFSNLTTDDFNSLLASLGDSSAAGGQSDSNNGLLSGFNLDTDLSAFLNTDINPSQGGS